MSTTKEIATRPELTFDGCGINGPDEYRTRIATFQREQWDAADTLKYGKLFAAAPQMRGLAVLCNCYLEPIADQLEICHSQPHEAKALRQLLEMARKILSEIK